MNFFGEQSIRLLRDDWETTKMLAEELFAMTAGSQEPLPTLDVQPTTEGQPYFNLSNYSPGDTIFSITGRSGEPFGGFTIENGDLVFLPAETGDPPASVPSKSKKDDEQATGANCFPGIVVGGSGSVYNVSITTSGGTKTVSVTQLQIDPNEVIPPGTAALVVKVGGKYSMQVPVFL